MTRKPRTTKPKVWGGEIFVEGNQCRAFVAANSQREAAKYLDVSLHQIQNYWSVTGNTTEIAMATHEIGQVFYYPSRYGFPERL